MVWKWACCLSWNYKHVYWLKALNGSPSPPWQLRSSFRDVIVFEVHVKWGRLDLWVRSGIENNKKNWSNVTYWRKVLGSSLIQELGAQKGKERIGEKHDTPSLLTSLIFFFKSFQLTERIKQVEMTEKAVNRTIILSYILCPNCVIYQ